LCAAKITQRDIGPTGRESDDPCIEFPEEAPM
jgi:hypothetical protein